MATATHHAALERCLYVLANLPLANAQVVRESFERALNEALFAAGSIHPLANAVNQLRVADALNELLERTRSRYEAVRTEGLDIVRGDRPSIEAAPLFALCSALRDMVYAIREVEQLCREGTAVRAHAVELVDLETALREAGLEKVKSGPPERYTRVLN